MSRDKIIEIFLLFLRLGLTSFGGPIAHLGYFRGEFVERRKWLSEDAYADLVAMCQFLPGPASSQVGMAIGLTRGGYAGMFAAWVGFTLPSAILMTVFAYGVSIWDDALDSGWLHGLKVAAVAVVAVAVLGMARSLAPDRPRASLAVGAMVLALMIPGVWGQLSALLIAGLFGAAFLRHDIFSVPDHLPETGSRFVSIGALCLFVALFFGLPVLAAVTQNPSIDLFTIFYRAGSLVFGGGHVVLPLLQAGMVPTGLMSNDAFLAGYGAVQAVPGPLFTFAAYLGAIIGINGAGWLGALLCIAAIFLPSMLLVVGVLPFWSGLRGRPLARASLNGINAAVVGLLLAAFYTPVFTAGILGPADFALATTAFLMLFLWKIPPWAVVLFCALGGQLLA